MQISSALKKNASERERHGRQQQKTNKNKFKVDGDNDQTLKPAIRFLNAHYIYLHYMRSSKFIA